MTKLKLIPRAQRGTRIVPNGRQVLPAGMTIDQYLKGASQQLRDYMYASENPAAVGNAQPNDYIIQQALNTISGNGSVAPQIPQQQVAQQPIPAAKRNVQIPADALAGIQFKAPDLGLGLKGTDAAPIKAKVGKGDVPGRDTSVQQAVQQRINANPNAFFFK